MEDPAFRDEAKAQSFAWTERERVAKVAQRLLLSCSDNVGATAKVATDPHALLEAIGMTEEEPEDPTLMRVTWRLKRVLTKLGFSCEDLAREALAAITGKADWNVKFCLRYYHFLKNPALLRKPVKPPRDDEGVASGQGPVWWEWLF